MPGRPVAFPFSEPPPDKARLITLIRPGQSACGRRLARLKFRAPIAACRVRAARPQRQRREAPGPGVASP